MQFPSANSNYAEISADQKKLMIEINFGFCELMECVLTGATRAINARKIAAKLMSGSSAYDWTSEIGGVCVERALAKAMGIYYESKHKKERGPDVAGYYVRWTKHRHGHLNVHPHDPTDEMFILVVGTGFKYFVIGGMNGKDAKKDSYWKRIESTRENGGPEWWIPQSDLIPIEELLNLNLHPMRR